MLDSDLVWYGSAAMPADDSSTQGGAIDVGSGALPEGTPGAMFPSVAIPVAGDPDIVHRYKKFVQNDDLTDTLADGVIWMVNGMKLNTTGGAVTIITATAETGVARVAGYSAGSPTSEDISIAGPAGSYIGVTVFDALEVWWVQLLTASVGGSQRTALDDVQIWRGDQLGTIPGPYDTGTETTNFNHATAEYEIALDSAINGSTTAANRLTNPAAGISAFSRAWNEDNGILVPADLTPGDNIGVWMRRTVRAGLTKPVNPMFPATIISGTV